MARERAAAAVARERAAAASARERAAAAAQERAAARRPAILAGTHNHSHRPCSNRLGNDSRSPNNWHSLPLSHNSRPGKRNSQLAERVAAEAEAEAEGLRLRHKNQGLSISEGRA